MSTTLASLNNNNLKNGKILIPKTAWDSSLPIVSLPFPAASCIVFVIATLCFWNSIGGDFVFDDTEAIVNNKDLHPETPVRVLFVHDFWGGNVKTNTSHKSYRPLTVLTFRWNYYLSGGLRPWGFHFTNIVLHGLVCMLALHCFSIIFGDRSSSSSHSKASFLAAILFTVHPIHTESVAAMVGRADLLSALFFFAAFIAYTKSCCYNGVSFRPSSFSPGILLICLCFCAVSMLCKEQGITVIGLCSIYDIFVICRISPLILLKNFLKQNTFCNNNSYPVTDIKSKNKEVAEWIKAVILRHLILLFSTVLMLVVRLQVMGVAPPTFQKLDNPASFSNNFWIRVINYNYIYALNAWLLIHPWWLCFDWSMGCVPLIQSILDVRILAVGIFWMTMWVLIAHCFAESSKNIHRYLIMGLSLLIIPFLPAANLFFRVGFVIAERVLYLPCAGFSITVVVGFRQLYQYKMTRKVATFGIYILILLFIGKSIQRSEEWKMEETLFQSGLKICPLNAKVHYNVAKILGDTGKVSEAMEQYREAIRLNPDYDQAMNNLANILRERGELIEAESLLYKAIKLRPTFAAAWMNLGIVQSNLKKIELSEKSYLMALQHRRNYPDCYYNLGNLFLEQKRHQEALAAWENAVRLKPTHTHAWNNMVIMLDSIEEYNKAEEIAIKGVKIVEDASLHFNLANILGKLGKYEESEYYFLRAISLDPHQSIYFSNLGVLYHRWEKWQLAAEAYNKALTLSPSRTNIEEYLKTVQYKLDKAKE